MDHSSPDERLINSPGPAGIVSKGPVLSASSVSVSTGRRLTLSGLVCARRLLQNPTIIMHPCRKVTHGQRLSLMTKYGADYWGLPVASHDVGFTWVVHHRLFVLKSYSILRSFWADLRQCDVKLCFIIMREWRENYHIADRKLRFMWWRKS